MDRLKIAIIRVIIGWGSLFWGLILPKCMK
jgi:molybdopterin-binding protein